MILDRIEAAGLYRNISPGIARALDFLREPATATLPEGRYELSNDRVFALVQHYETKLFDQCVWEAHRKYIDVQFIAAGVERMGSARIARMRETQPYDPERDFALFTGDGDFFTVEAGGLAIFFPHDVHMPQLATGAPARVRKIVVKVAVSS
jgi:YhcH/YjgK/YiaL family protein